VFNGTVRTGRKFVEFGRRDGRWMGQVDGADPGGRWWGGNC